MDVINIAKEQMNSGNQLDMIFTEYDFFNEYFKVFNNNENYQEITKKNIESIDYQVAMERSNLLYNMTLDKLDSLEEIIELKNQPGIIIFIGNGSWDGHGIILDNQPFVFYDLAAIFNDSFTYNLEAYVAHELIHPIHYNLNSSFYPGNYQKIEDKYLKKLIAEGLATYLGNNLIDFNIGESYWLGLLKTGEVQQWIENCLLERKRIGNDINDSIREDKFNENLYYKLFSVTDSELINHRFGYYYGSRIIDMATKDYGIKNLLHLDYKNYYNYIKEYFR